MKTIVQEKKSIFSKLIDKLKRTALFDMLLNPDSGTVITPEELDSEAQIKRLANASGISEREMLNIETAFNKAESLIAPIEKKVSQLPPEEKESSNPFKVKEEDLVHDKPNPKTKLRKGGERERVD